MKKKQWAAAVLLLSLLPALLGGCFTVDIQVPADGQQQAALSAEADTTASAAAYADTSTDGGAAPSAGDLTALSMKEQLSYFNIALNRIKAEKAGFKKSKLTATEDIILSNTLANTLVSLVKGALLSETATETVVAKGESSDDVMSPDGASYVSHLTEEDVERIDVVPAGGGFTVTVYVKDETSPAASGSRFSRIFEFMTVDDVENVYAPKVNAEVAREDIEVVYEDCFAKATIDANGNVTEYETYVRGTMILKNAKVRVITTDVNAVLASTTRYTDFTY